MRLLNFNTQVMKHPLTFAVMAITCLIQAYADDFTAISETGTGYQNQTWFYSGAGQELAQDKIKKYWDEGKRITSISYTDLGWFVVMSKNSGYTMQTYHYDKSWPTDWLTENEKQGYRITAVSNSGSKWLIVMSQGTGITTQTWFYGEWNSLTDRISDRWKDKYHITSVVWDGKAWFVVMSKGSKYSHQRINWASSYSGIRDKIKKAWDAGYSLQLLNKGEGNYVAVTTKFVDGHTPQQSFVGSSSDIKSTIHKWWDSKKSIVFVGGGDALQWTTYASNNSNSNNSNNSNNNSNNNYNNTATGKYSVQTMANGGKRENLPDGGFRISRTQKDGSQTFYEEHPCYICKGDGKCHICWGTGGTLNGYTGIFYPCSGCARAGGINKCYACQGKGKTTLTGTYKDGVAQSIGNDGRMYIGTADGSNSRSSSRSRSKSRNRSNDYVETIEYAPNYTGGDNSQWCEKCHKYAPAHSHIRKRVH